MNKKGFTLAELLIALGIIGAIAAMTIPSLMTSVNNKILATKLKNNIQALETLIGSQMIDNKTNDLSKTDFADPDKLLTNKNFDIVKICTGDTAYRDCWKIKKAAEEEGQPNVAGEVNYRYLKKLDETKIPIDENLRTIVLKNGAIMNYGKPESLSSHQGTDNDIGFFDIDVNGNDGPNIVGRDAFTFLITKKGVIRGYDDSADRATLVTKCKTGMGYCSSLVIQDNWKIKY